jgi:TATA-box binding protein (TBP) (component of TFIID and TFIIIB)
MLRNVISWETMVEEKTSFIWPKINNVKVRLKVNHSDIETLHRFALAFGCANPNVSYEKKRKTKKLKVKPLFKQGHNYMVIRGNNVYTVFHKTGAVNITGIKCLCLVPKAVTDFCIQFGVNENLISTPIVDNCTATGNFNRAINLFQLKDLVNKEKNSLAIYSAAYNPGHFPAAFCRTVGSTTCSVFPKGVYNIIGAKCLEDIGEIMKHMTALILRL